MSPFKKPSSALGALLGGAHAFPAETRAGFFYRLLSELQKFRVLRCFKSKMHDNSDNGLQWVQCTMKNPTQSKRDEYQRIHWVLSGSTLWVYPSVSCCLSAVGSRVSLRVFSLGPRRRLFSIHLKSEQRLQTRPGQRSALNRDGHCLLAGRPQRPMKMQSKQTAQPNGSLLQCPY